ncbi:hypothetical protein [Pusillimonas noertemannii]|nr:hypothetical protein [Pusillimonas noertemannii]NYT68793.1 hypothetical protein [Pusillimonas noertemannii]TFL10829.1 hypothetical protein CSC72_09975 [Pusillimonas noertemannii]
MARNVIINHPNTFNCQVFRKRVTRPGPESGGMPTMGGLAVMSSDDEEQVKWEFIGNGYTMQAEQFNPSVMMDRMDANNNSGDEFRFLIEPAEAPGMPNSFEVKKNDVALIMLGEGVRVAYEVVQVETTINIPPYVMRYVMNRRGDMDTFSALDFEPGPGAEPPSGEPAP